MLCRSVYIPLENKLLAYKLTLRTDAKTACQPQQTERMFRNKRRDVTRSMTYKLDSYVFGSYSALICLVFFIDPHLTFEQ